MDLALENRPVSFRAGSDFFSETDYSEWANTKDFQANKGCFCLYIHKRHLHVFAGMSIKKQLQTLPC